MRGLGNGEPSKVYVIWMRDGLGGRFFATNRMSGQRWALGRVCRWSE